MSRQKYQNKRTLSFYSSMIWCVSKNICKCSTILFLLSIASPFFTVFFLRSMFSLNWVSWQISDRRLLQNCLKIMDHNCWMNHNISNYTLFRFDFISSGSVILMMMTFMLLRPSSYYANEWRKLETQFFKNPL